MGSSSDQSCPMMKGFLQLCLTEHRVSWYGGASNLAEPCFTVHFFEIYHNNISWKISSSIHSHYSHLKSNGVSPAFPLCTCSGCPQKDGTLKIMLSPFPKLQQFFLKYLVYSHYSLYLYSYLYISVPSIHIYTYLYISISFYIYFCRSLTLLIQTWEIITSPRHRNRFLAKIIPSPAWGSYGSESWECAPYPIGFP